MSTLEILKKLAHVFNYMSNYIIFKMFSGFCRHGTGGKRHAILMQMADAGSISSKICITQVVEKLLVVGIQKGATQNAIINAIFCRLIMLH